MKKIIIVILSIVIAILSIIVYNIYEYNNKKIESQKNNSNFESAYGKEILGTDVISLINKAIDNNEKNKVEKDAKGTYIENNINSIKIDVKFKEMDNVISMEAINSQGAVNFAINFGAATFKCTKLEYHEKTKNIKYMYFEQI